MKKDPPPMASPAHSQRTGARRRSEIPPEILEQLQSGRIESVTLVEGLAIDFARLMASAVPDLPRESLETMHAASPLGITRRMALAGELLLQHLGSPGWLRLRRHRSDTVRGWAAYLLAATPDFTLGERLHLLQPLADDHNPGVREWAWLALRPRLAEDIAHAISLLAPWTASTSPFLRRFASEATRPRGVWCSHIDALKTRPELARAILEPLRADPHKYVQDSVANWLNDAGKTQPAWVQNLCTRWLRQSPNPATERICRRARRNL